MAFSLPDLPYPHDALSPRACRARRLEFHHDIHHKAYVDNGNKAVAGTEWENKSLEEIVAGTYQPGRRGAVGIFNNASQHWNHNQFWQWMTPGDSPHARRGSERAITEAFGSVQDFKTSSTPRRGPVRLGLGVARQGQGRQPQDHQDRERREPALLRPDRAPGCDVWEHSYYIDFRNKRPPTSRTSSTTS
jgi:Fe-Mn family superoxide dismutase